MKTLIVICIFLSSQLYAQEQLYNPKADAKAEIVLAINQAEKEGKYVFLQIGGDWCPWCIKFHQFISNDKELDSILHANYLVVLVNYSPENTNAEILKELDFPNRFGFPVFVILNEKGERLHTQNSWYLEQDKAYHKRKTISFLKNWSKSAINQINYKDL